jgi:hypothetical protein
MSSSFGKKKETVRRETRKENESVVHMVGVRMKFKTKKIIFQIVQCQPEYKKKPYKKIVVVQNKSNLLLKIILCKT